MKPSTLRSKLFQYLRENARIEVSLMPKKVLGMVNIQGRGVIRINSRQNLKAREKTLIHEVLHRLFPQCPEDAILALENLVHLTLTDRGHAILKKYIK